MFCILRTSHVLEAFSARDPRGPSLKKMASGLNRGCWGNITGEAEATEKGGHSVEDWSWRVQTLMAKFVRGAMEKGMQLRGEDRAGAGVPRAPDTGLLTWGEGRPRPHNVHSFKACPPPRSH